MIGSHFKNVWSSLFFVKQTARVMNGERRRVVIGMSAFVRLRDHELRFQLREELGQFKRNADELMSGILIGNAKLDNAVFTNSGERERRQSLFPASSRIIVSAGETIAIRIEHVDRRTVSNMNYVTLLKM
jgi:hypothetical protein